MSQANLMLVFLGFFLGVLVCAVDEKRIVALWVLDKIKRVWAFAKEKWAQRRA